MILFRHRLKNLAQVQVVAPDNDDDYDDDDDDHDYDDGHDDYRDDHDDDYEIRASRIERSITGAKKK